MLFASLKSGSSGNAFYVEAGEVSLLFDAGLSAKQLREQLEAIGRSPSNIDVLIVSHEHSDHSCGIGVIARKYGIPVYISQRTLGASRSQNIGIIPEIIHFTPGQSFKVGDISIETIATPHDAVDGSAFAVTYNGTKLGICTDLGHVFKDLRDLVAQVDALYIESNYDTDMLLNGPYPASLKRRIMGPGGHLSNAEAAELIASEATSRLQWLCLGHLSEHNNNPEITLNTHKAIHGDRLPITIAPRYRPTALLSIKAAPNLYQAASPWQDFWSGA